MRLRIAAIVLIGGVVLGAWSWWRDDGADGDRVVDPTVEVLHMNLCGALGCYGEEVPDRLEVVGYAAARIAGARADVVALNEVCFDQVDGIVAGLAGPWPMSAVTVETLATGNGCAGVPYGNAVLYRGELLGRRAFGSCGEGRPPCLANPPRALSAEQRAMVCADVRLPDATELTACSVHLVPRGRQQLGERTWDQWHDLQLRSLQSLVAAELDDGAPVVVGGDLNVGPRDVLVGWPDGWTELDPRHRPTRPVPEPRRKLDYLLLSPALRSERSELLLVDRCPSSRADGWCTDHVPLAGTVSIKPAAGVDPG